MKKFIIIFLLLLPFGAVSQTADFLHSDLLSMTSEGFKKAKYKYISKTNSYLFEKKYKEIARAAVVQEEIKQSPVPKSDDCTILVKKAREGISSITYEFYNSGQYETLLQFANEKGQNKQVTEAKGLHKISYNYGDYSFELVKTVIEVSGYEPYGAFIYSINTGKEPYVEPMVPKEKKSKK